jgi:hypothetical protein
MSIADTLTIVLDGEIALSQFASTIDSFYELVTALSVEAGSPDLDWVLEDLQVSSMFATVRASTDPKSIKKVVDAYGEVGQALQSGRPIASSPRVQNAARRVVSISDARVKSVRFETSFRESIVKVTPTKEIIPAHFAPVETVPLELSPPPANITTVSAPLIIAMPAAFGGIQGRVQALSSRGGLRFTIYDTLYDKAIGCYIAEGQEELLRNIWGRLAVVEGMITRDPVTGRPLSIRQVVNITPLPDPYSKREYEEARGIVRPLVGISPEEAIRRMRDA